jgi:hypothetical protein
VLIAHARQRLFAIVRTIDAESLVNQCRGHSFTERAFILDDKRARAGRDRGRRLRGDRFGDSNRGATNRQFEQE